jgi:hypothetical protein
MCSPGTDLPIARQSLSKAPAMTARDTKNMINLENVLLVEDKLWTILESFRYLQHQS